MKRIAIIFSFVLLAAATIGCKKDAAINTSLQGNWELSKTSGMSGYLDIAPGSGNIFKFTGNKYYQYINGSLQSSGTFTTKQTNSYMPGALFSGELSLHGDYDEKYNFAVTSNNTLVIDFNSFVDGPINTYTRQ